MTRRIAITILLTVWAVLIAAGATAYLTTRSVLLTALDASLVSRALSLPTLVRPAGQEVPSPTVDRADRWIVKDEVGRTLERPSAASNSTGPSPLLEAHFSTSSDGGLLRTVTVRAARWPAAATRGSGVSQPLATSVIYTGSAQEYARVLTRLWWALAGVGLAAGLLAAGVAVQVSRVALRPLRATAEQIGAIDEQHLDRRIPVNDLPPELATVGRRLNDMIARLQQAFELRRRFLADASHELRTPVAALVTTLEVTLARPRSADAYLQTLKTCLGDADLLRRLVERLMEQVRSETLSKDEPESAVDIARLLTECVSSIAPLAAVREIRVVADYPSQLVCQTREHRLRTIVMNLLSNAVEYNCQAGTITLATRCNGDGLRFSVTDTGMGIPSESLPHLFEPFFRGDKSRRTDAGHLGLGLALVQSHTRALGGICTVESEVGKGTRFEIYLSGVHEIIL